MSRSRVPLVLGGTAAAGIGYYLYTAGGDGKAAQKQAEADVHKLSGKFQREANHGKEEAEGLGKKVGAKVDSSLSKTEAELSKARADAEAYSKDTKNAALKKINEFDNKVEAEASKAKSGISSWFGGK
ncbi:hypothetical protein GGS24DRAFT_405813 [Hypoxylon argillaceum]|nr:hypothetical protein GGS24DRAFT_405813 [Hypoxylon argillaceum]KAI1148013.1 hypothetical protein F4825DRAFT_116543 [Nemania diffusa]